MAQALALAATPLFQTAVAVGGTVIAAVGQHQAMTYQAAVLERQQEIEEENARRIRKASQAEGQQADFEAAEILAQQLANQGASGFDVDSPSFIRRRDKNKLTATVNRQRIIQDGNLQAESAENRALEAGMEAKQTKRARFFNLAGAPFSIGSDLISGASLVNEQKARRITTNSRGI